MRKLKLLAFFRGVTLKYKLTKIDTKHISLEMAIQPKLNLCIDPLREWWGGGASQHFNVYSVIKLNIYMSTRFLDNSA